MTSIRRAVVVALLTLVACDSTTGPRVRVTPQDPPSRSDATPQPSGSCGAATLPPPPAPRPRYRMTVVVDPTEGIARGHMRVAIVPDLAIDRLVFRLWPNAPRDDGGAVLHASEVSVDGQRRPVNRPDPTTMVVHLDEPVEPGRKVVTTMSWLLELPSPVEDRISQRGDAVHLGSFFPLLAWEPGRGWMTDRPIEILGEASASPTADFHVRVLTDPDLRVLASGVQIDGNLWVANAVRDFAIAVAPFDFATVTTRAPKTVTVKVGVVRGLPAHAEAFAERVARALRSLSRRFGDYPWPTLNLAVMPDLERTGIEYPTMIFQGAGSLHYATTHEVAHQWFYSLVGSNPARDPWMDESLATYSHVVTDGLVDAFESAVIPPSLRDHVGESMAYWDRREPRGYFQGIYVRGAQVLLSLGPPNQVDCALHRYVTENAYSIATEDALIDALARVDADARTKLRSAGIPST